MTKARANAYGTTTLGSSTLTLGSTTTSISGLTVSSPTVTGTLTAASTSGTSGQLLSSTGTGVQWVAAPASGSMTLLSTTTLSGTSVVLSSISQSYMDLILLINGVYYSANGNTIRINPNNTASAVVASKIEYLNTTATATNIEGASDNLTISTPASAYKLQISNYASATYGKPFILYGSDNTIAKIEFGDVNLTSAITSLNLVLTSTGSFSGGQALLYGVN